MTQTPSLPFSSTRKFGGLLFLSGDAASFTEPRPLRTTVRADLMLPGALLEPTVFAALSQ